MKQLILLSLFLCSHSLFSQTKFADTIFSKKLNEKRAITIGLPPSYEKNKDLKYPILVLLDSEFLFDPFQGALNYGYYWDDFPELIIVGIHQNKNYIRESDCEVDETNGLPTQKGGDFFEFIGSELLPYIEKNYRTESFKIIAGLDTTAGFMNYYLYKDDSLFNAYISMSPEFSKEMEDRVPARLDALQKPIFYYCSSADGDFESMRSKVQTMAETIKKIKNPTFTFRYENFSNTSHYSSVLYSIPSALYELFSSYQPISISEFKEKIVTLKEGYVDYLINKYDAVEKNLGLKLPIRINDFKAIEAAILKNQAYNEFDLLSQIAQKNYPKSMLADYEMGLMYEKKGDLKRAIRSYQFAYQQQEIGDLTKEMMLDKIEDLKMNLKQEEKYDQNATDGVPQVEMGPIEPEEETKP